MLLILFLNGGEIVFRCNNLEEFIRVFKRRNKRYKKKWNVCCFWVVKWRDFCFHAFLQLHFPGFKKEKVFSELQLCYNVILILLTLSETADDSCMSTVVVVFYDARAPPGGHLDHYTCQAWIKWDQQNTHPHFGQFISNHDTVIVVFFQNKMLYSFTLFYIQNIFPTEEVGGWGRRRGGWTFMYAH